MVGVESRGRGTFRVTVKGMAMRTFAATRRVAYVVTFASTVMIYGYCHAAIRFMGRVPIPPYPHTPIHPYPHTPCHAAIRFMGTGTVTGRIRVRKL